MTNKETVDPQEAISATEGERVALRWYAEQVAGCRKIGKLGDPFRHALNADGGKRALDALTLVNRRPINFSDRHRLIEMLRARSRSGRRRTSGRYEVSYELLDLAIAEIEDAALTCISQEERIAELTKWREGGKLFDALCWVRHANACDFSGDLKKLSPFEAYDKAVLACFKAIEAALTNTGEVHTVNS